MKLKQNKIIKNQVSKKYQKNIKSIKRKKNW